LSRILKVEKDKVTIGSEDGSIEEVPFSALNFGDPRVGENVDVFRQGGEVIVSRAEEGGADPEGAEDAAPDEDSYNPNTGYQNTGYRNAGNRNTGYQQNPNFGNQNAGYQQNPNFGNQNAGYQQNPNFGYQNAGYQQNPNYGYQNAGYQQNPNYGYQNAGYQQAGYQGQAQYGQPYPAEYDGHDVRSMDKHIFVWVGCFLFGWLGVDRFMRGQIGLCILKLLTAGGAGIWALVDFIIGLVKVYGDAFGAGEQVVFVDKHYAR
jgi:TM2 domain-containing membrane protein YozV